MNLKIIMRNVRMLFFFSSADVTSQTKPVSPSVLQPVIQTRKKPSPTVNTSNSLSEPVKTNQTTRRRRRTDPFTRKIHHRSSINN